MNPLDLINCYERVFSVKLLEPNEEKSFLSLNKRLKSISCLVLSFTEPKGFAALSW